MSRSRKIRVPGGTIYATGGRLVAAVPLGWGGGRKRATAPDTPEGLERLRRWVAREVAASATGQRELSPAEEADALAALAILPEGVSLVDAARLAAEDARVERPRAVGDAAGEYLAHLVSAGRRPRTLSSARHKLGRLREIWAKPLSAVGVAEAERICAAEACAVTRNGTRAALAAFWAWAVRRGYARRNPFALVERAGGDETIPEIYAPGEVVRLFRAAEDEPRFRRWIPFLALRFFAGVRTSALMRMDVGAIDLAAGLVAVPPHADKKRRGYYAHANPTLRAWLSAYPPEGRIAPLRCESRVYGALREIHARAGVVARPNAARHTFASYALAAGEDAPAVALAMGHFRDTATLFAHYRALATPKAAAVFFAILPTRRA